MRVKVRTDYYQSFDGDVPYTLGFDRQLLYDAVDLLADRAEAIERERRAMPVVEFVNKLFNYYYPQLISMLTDEKYQASELVCDESKFTRLMQIRAAANALTQQKDTP